MQIENTTLTVYITVEPFFREEDGDFIDLYNYSVYLAGDQVSYALAYSFAGPGPQVPSLSSIALGITYAIWSIGAAAGPPHHLEVFFDSNEGTCGGRGVKKVMIYRIVDSSGKRAGNTNSRVIENTGGGITDSCSGSSVSTTNTCSAIVDSQGRYQDGLQTGCPAEGVTNCGFDIPQNKWQLCGARDIAPVTLAQIKYEVRFTEVKVNDRPGNMFWPRGSKFFPNGTWSIP